MGNVNSHLMPTYKRLPVSFVRGQGAWLWDDQGNKYLDALCGIAVTALGHSHPAVANALADQARTLTHTSNLYRIPQQEELGEKLCALSGMARAFLCNSGAEANEAAIKIARKYGHQRDVQIPGIIVTEGGFHGRTLATLTATGSQKVQAGFEPLPLGFSRVPFNDPAAVDNMAKKDHSIVAVLVEPVQGEAGINIPSPGYLSRLREICTNNNWLLMLDEIQTGMGRTGHWFAFQRDKIIPDVVTIAKALGNGVPIGACLAQGEAAEVLTAGSHGTTFGGNPLACRAALTVIEQIERNRLVSRAGELGYRILHELQQQLRDESRITSIRGLGLMIALDFDRPCAELVTICLQQGLLINVTAEKSVRLLPPFILSNDEADLLVERLVNAIRAYN